MQRKKWLLLAGTLPVLLTALLVTTASQGALSFRFSFPKPTPLAQTTGPQAGAAPKGSQQSTAGPHLSPSPGSSQNPNIVPVQTPDPPAPPASNAAAPASPISGTWVLQQALSSSDVDTSNVETALSTPGIRGYSLRVAWNAIDGNNQILDQGLAVAKAHNLAFSVRFMAGQWTPSEVINAGPNYQWNGMSIPTPFNADGSPNTAFEQAYAAKVSSLAAWCRANGVHLLHLPWYGQAWAELNNGIEVRSAPGYTYSAWLNAHERLVNIALQNAGPDLTVEFPLSGYGPLNQADADLAQYIASQPNHANIVVQANGLGPQSWGIGDWGTTDATTESVKDNAVWSEPIGRGEQMIQPGDYDWNPIFGDLQGNQAQYVEIYAGSFGAGLAHHADLLSAVAGFA